MTGTASKEQSSPCTSSQYSKEAQEILKKLHQRQRRRGAPYGLLFMFIGALAILLAMFAQNLPVIIPIPLGPLVPIPIFGLRLPAILGNIELALCGVFFVALGVGVMIYAKGKPKSRFCPTCQKMTDHVCLGGKSQKNSTIWIYTCLSCIKDNTETWVKRASC